MAGVKLFATVGAATTVRLAEAMFEAGDVRVLSEPVVLVAAPSVALVTFSVTVQVPLAGSEPPVSWMPVLPAASAAPTWFTIVSAQVLATTVALKSVMPAGKLSANDCTVSAAAFGFWIASVSVVLPPEASSVAPKDFVSVGARVPPAAVSVSRAVLPVSAMVPVAVTALVVFWSPPAGLAEARVTATVITQDVFTGIVPALKLTLEGPLGLVIVPRHPAAVLAAVNAAEPAATLVMAPG